MSSSKICSRDTKTTNISRLLFLIFGNRKPRSKKKSRQEIGGRIVLLFLYFFCFFGRASIDQITIHNLSNHNEKFAFSENRAGTVTFTWTTDVPATSQVHYGLNQANLELSSRLDPRFKTKHIMRIQYRLVEGQTYYYQLVSRDAQGNQMLSVIDSFEVPQDSKWWEVAHENQYKKNNFNPETRWIRGGNYYRKQVSLASGVETAWIQMNRWERYEGGIQLYVNGNLAGSWSFGYSLSTLDITSFLNIGENTLALGVEAGEPVQVLLDGEVVFTDGSTFPLSTSSSGWKTSSIFVAGWEQPGFPDTNWDEAITGSAPSANTGWYSPLLVAELPLITSINETRVRYTQVLARRNRILDQSILSYRNQRHFLDVMDSDKTTAEMLAVETLIKLYDVQPLFDVACASIKAGNNSAALVALSDLEQAMNDAELLCQVIENLMEASSQLTNLEGVLQMSANPGDLASTLVSATARLSAARVAISNEDFTFASNECLGIQSQLDLAKEKSECLNDQNISAHNESEYSPFGWIRARGQYLDRVFPGYYDLQDGVLRFGPGEDFSILPSDLFPAFRDSANFVSPFVGLNTSQPTLDISNNMKQVAFETAGSPSIQELSPGVIFDLNADPVWTGNWLLLWDNTTANRVFLVVFARQPDSLTFVDGKIRITRSSGVGELVVHSMYPAGESLTSDTTEILSWETGLPAPVQADLGTLSRMMVNLPLGYTELYSEDPSNSTGHVQMRYRYHNLGDDWATVPLPFAPIPNALSLARNNGFSTLSVTESIVDTRLSTGQWGPFEVAMNTDSLNYSFPLLNPAPLNGVNESIGKGFIRTEQAETTGFNAIRGQILIQDEFGGTGGFVLRAGWQTILTAALTEANDAGLTAVFFIWNNAGLNDSLETEPDYQDAFVDGWGQVASIARNFNVIYDLSNEPRFSSVNAYNTLMARTAEAIRATDSVNAITIEGFRNYSQDFSGMIHPADIIPNIDNIWFQFHPYNNHLFQNMSTLDTYYPGYVMNWWGNTYYDRDAYVAERWVPALRTMYLDERIRLINGEFGFQQTAPGVAEAMARDSVLLARRFQTHQFYFVTTGWSGFDLYGGEGDTLMERTNITGILMDLTQVKENYFCLFLENLEFWRSPVGTDSCGNSNTSVLVLTSYVNNGYLCTP